MRRTFVSALTTLSRRFPDTVLITGDLGFNQFEEFREEFPKRFINAGIAEQNMVGIAAGLAQAGWKPYVYSILPFVSHRPFEHIRNDLCYHNLSVTLVACGTGMSYGSAGVTHHGTEDLATLSALPNMTIVSPTHRAEVEGAVAASYEHRGPLYIRLTRGPAPDFERLDSDFEIGAGCFVRRSRPADVSIVVTADLSSNALDAVELLEARGHRCSLVSMHTVKPLDVVLLSELMRETRLLVSLEEHNLHGGLGSAIASYVAQQDSRCAFRMIGMPDEFCKATGNEADLREHYGLDPEGICRAIETYLSQVEP